MSAQDIESKPKQKVERSEESTRPGVYFQPAVDIFETPEELVVLADLPGVPSGGVEVRVDGDELTIEGCVPGEGYAGLKPLHVEYGVGGYYRRFTLGETIDRDRIQAQLRNGVLALKLPKADRAKTRTIPVQAA